MRWVLVYDENVIAIIDTMGVVYSNATKEEFETKEQALLRIEELGLQYTEEGEI